VLVFALFALSDFLSGARKRVTQIAPIVSGEQGTVEPGQRRELA